MPEVTKISHGLTIGDLKYGNTRPGVVEAILKPGETMEEALDELDDRLNAWHKRRYPHLYLEGANGSDLPPHLKTEITFGPVPVIQVNSEDREIGNILYGISTAKDLKVLDSYKFIAKLNPDHQEAYNERLKELTK
jgi:hypothetical protein